MLKDIFCNLLPGPSHGTTGFVYRWNSNNLLCQKVSTLPILENVTSKVSFLEASLSEIESNWTEFLVCINIYIYHWIFVKHHDPGGND